MNTSGEIFQIKRGDRWSVSLDIDDLINLDKNYVQN